MTLAWWVLPLLLLLPPIFIFWAFGRDSEWGGWRSSSRYVPLIVVVIAMIVVMNSGILAPQQAPAPAQNATAPAPAPVNSTSNSTSSDPLNETVKTLSSLLVMLLPLVVVIGVIGAVLGMVTGRRGILGGLGREDRMFENIQSEIRRSRAEIPPLPRDELEESKETPNAAEALEQPARPRSIDEPPTPAQRIRRDDS